MELGLDLTLCDPVYYSFKYTPKNPQASGMVLVTLEGKIGHSVVATAFQSNNT